MMFVHVEAAKSIKNVAVLTNKIKNVIENK